MSRRPVVSLFAVIGACALSAVIGAASVYATTDRPTYDLVATFHAFGDDRDVIDYDLSRQDCAASRDMIDSATGDLVSFTCEAR